MCTHTHCYYFRGHFVKLRLPPFPVSRNQSSVPRLKRSAPSIPLLRRVLVPFPFFPLIADYSPSPLHFAMPQIILHSAIRTTILEAKRKQKSGRSVGSNEQEVPFLIAFTEPQRTALWRGRGSLLKNTVLLRIFVPRVGWETTVAFALPDRLYFSCRVRLCPVCRIGMVIVYIGMTAPNYGRGKKSEGGEPFFTCCTTILLRATDEETQTREL